MTITKVCLFTKTGGAFENYELRSDGDGMPEELAAKRL